MTFISLTCYCPVKSFNFCKLLYKHIFVLTSTTVSAGGFPVYPALGELMPHILTVERGEVMLDTSVRMSQGHFD